MNFIFNNQKGVTLAEIVIAVGISGIVMAGVMTLFITQQKTYSEQEQVVEMQQNARNAKQLMVYNLRMAGYDPEGDLGLLNGISNPGTNTLTMNYWDGAQQTIVYSYDAVDNEIEQTINAGAASPIAYEIDAIGFAYAIDIDDNGIETDAAGNIIWAWQNGIKWINLDADGDGELTTADDLGNTANELDDGANIDDYDPSFIRAVRIYILARTRGVKRGFSNNSRYVVGYNIFNANDNIPRELLIATVRCRNMGL